jgi:carbon storage regulator CsrA
VLILRRNVGESIVIGEGEAAIHVTLVSITDRRATIGVMASPEIPIDRLEVRQQREHQRKKEEHHD